MGSRKLERCHLIGYPKSLILLELQFLEGIVICAFRDFGAEAGKA